METSMMVNDYPMAPETKEDERKIEVDLTIEVSDLFPETWSSEEIKEYVRNHIDDYWRNSENIEIHEIRI